MADHDNSSDDDELELEPVDPEIIKHQQERAKRKTREAEDAVDINEVYDQENYGDPVDFEKLKQFRFTTQHLLMLTAVVAIATALYDRQGFCMGTFISAGITLGAGWWFVLREEKRRITELEKKQEKYARRSAARRAIEDGKPLPAAAAIEFEQSTGEFERDGDAFTFSFSMKEMLITFTAAALFFGLSRILGDSAALLLGGLAIIGLAVQAFRVKLPPLLVFGWWLLMVMYIAVSIVGAFGSPEAMPPS